MARLRELDGRSAVRVRGAGTEFDSLREYVVGDVRSIDWRATARAGGVVVRTWRPERDRHVLIVLDTGRTSAGRRRRTAARRGHGRGPAAGGAGDPRRGSSRPARLRPPPTGHRRTAVADGGPASARRRHGPARPELLETDFLGLAVEVMRRAGRHALVVLFTGLDAGPVEEGLLPVLGRLTHRHTVLVAAVADPRVAQMAAGRGDSEAVLQRRGRRARPGRPVPRLPPAERHGAHVVDAPPDELAPAVADAYLSLKAAGKLWRPHPVDHVHHPGGPFTRRRTLVNGPPAW